jgi:hypothetical protein
MIALFGEVNTLITGAEQKAAREYRDPVTGTLVGREPVAETQRKVHIQHVGTAATVQMRLDKLTGQRHAEIFGAMLAECASDPAKAKDLLKRWTDALNQASRPTLAQQLAADEAIRKAGGTPPSPVPGS